MNIPVKPIIFLGLMVTALVGAVGQDSRAPELSSALEESGGEWRINFSMVFHSDSTVFCEDLPWNLGQCLVVSIVPSRGGYEPLGRYHPAITRTFNKQNIKNGERLGGSYVINNEFPELKDALKRGSLWCMWGYLLKDDKGSVLATTSGSRLIQKGGETGDR